MMGALLLGGGPALRLPVPHLTLSTWPRGPAQTPKSSLWLRPDATVRGSGGTCMDRGVGWGGLGWQRGEQGVSERLTLPQIPALGSQTQAACRSRRPPPAATICGVGNASSRGHQAPTTPLPIPAAPMDVPPWHLGSGCPPAPRPASPSHSVLPGRGAGGSPSPCPPPPHLPAPLTRAQRGASRQARRSGGPMAERGAVRPPAPSFSPVPS